MRKEKSITPDHDTVLRGMLCKDDVQCSENRCNVEFTVFGITTEVTRQNTKVHVLNVVHLDRVFLFIRLPRPTVFFGVLDFERKSFREFSHGK